MPPRIFAGHTGARSRAQVRAGAPSLRSFPSVASFLEKQGRVVRCREGGGVEKGATTGRINCCDYFKILKGVYADIRWARRDSTSARLVQSLCPPPSNPFSRSFFPLARRPRVNGTGRHKLSQLRACQPLLKSGLPSEGRGLEKPVNETRIGTGRFAFHLPLRSADERHHSLSSNFLPFPAFAGNDVEGAQNVERFC